MPDDARHPRAAAEAVRGFLMLRLGLHLGLRQENLRQLLVCPLDQAPALERDIERLKRDVLATHVLSVTGSYEQASYAIQDTPKSVASHYGRFLPQDKAALAAKILNEVWDVAA